MKLQICIFSALALLIYNTGLGQEEKGKLSGSFQVDAQYYNDDTLIGAEQPSEKMLLNTYANFQYTQGGFNAGIRYEAFMNTLKGYTIPNGSGFVYKYASYKAENLEFTIGNYYEQFGNGLVYRTYEDIFLGYDNAMEGILVKYEPAKGVNLKGVWGKQRIFFSIGPGIVRGIDGEISLNEAFSSLSNIKPQIILGGSFVSKYQYPEDSYYKYPGNVGAWASRANINYGSVSVSGEYAYKINDPSSDNGFIYKPGEAFLINTTFTKKGIGLLLGAKYIDNMSFRSDRGAALQNLSINYLPAIAKNHTYGLVTIYPFATTITGEAGVNGEIFFMIPKKSLVGGKYGTVIIVNYSRVNDISKEQLNDSTLIGQAGTLGYKSSLFGFGDDVFFQDFNVEVTRKFSKKVKCVFTYLNMIYDYYILRGEYDHSGNREVKSDIAIADITYKFTSRKAVRTELQHLSTRQDQGSWAMGLVEFSIPHWFLTIQDTYNYGNDHDKLHYFNVAIIYIKNTNRIQIGYGKQRAGLVCVGGVCRPVPASNGLTLSITNSF